MTACTNHGGKARRVVTAALVGVLSVGTVPMAALAEGVSDGIETLAADWSTGAKVTEAEDGKGAAYTGDLTKPVSFDLGSGKYLVPTQVTNQNGDETDVTNMAITYAAQKDSTDASAPFDGIKASWSYTYVKDDGTYAPIVAGDALTVDHFEAYLAGRLYTCAGADATVNNGAVIPVAGTYTVTVGGQVSQSFTLVDEDPYAGAYAYVGTGKDVVFNYSPLMDGDIKFAKSNGDTIVWGTDYDGVIWYNADGTIADYTANTNAGTYTAVLTKGGAEVTRVNFTVEKYDVSKHAPAVADFVNGVNGTWTLDFSPNAGTDFLTNWLGAVAPDFEVVSATSPDGSNGFRDGRGEYTVTVKAKDGKDNVTGETTVTFSNLDKSLYSEVGIDLYYGAQDVSTDNIVTVNLTEGQSFDASRIAVREKDGSPSYSGDALEVTYKQGSTTVDASALSKAGTYEVTVRVKPFQDADGSWVGGTESFKVTVNGNKAYGDNVSFYVDGEVADATEQLEYDGTDLLQRVSARVSNPEGGQFEYGTDFELEAKNSKGEVVESVVDAGEYTVTIKPLTFTVDDGEIISFTLEVTPRQLDSLNDYTYTEGWKPWLSDDYAGHSDEAVAWTGSAVEVPGVQYWDDDAEAYVTLDPSLYNVVSIKQDGKVVKEAVDEGTYTVRIALSDEAKSNYSLADREFTFLVKKYSPFDDVKSPAWYAQVVNTAKYTNVVNGISGTNMYAPESEISRKDAVCIIFNMAGGDSWDGENDFTYSENGGWYTGFGDCDGNAYYAKALAWAHNLGIANGSNGSFRPDDRITREELASMLANYAKVTGDYVASDGSALAALPDAGSVSGWATENVAWAVENGVMGNGGSVNAGANITRAEVAAMAVNYAQKF